MRIIGVKQLEDCFNGSSLYEIVFDESWNRASIKALSACGTLEYFPDFPRPFFRLLIQGGAQLKGVEGESICKSIVKAEQLELLSENLASALKASREQPQKGDWSWEQG